MCEPKPEFCSNSIKELAQGIIEMILDSEKKGMIISYHELFLEVKKGLKDKIK